MTPSPVIEPGPHGWEASALTTSPSLLPRLTHLLLPLRLSVPSFQNIHTLTVSYIFFNVSTENLVVYFDHVTNSPHLSHLHCIDIVRRNRMLITNLWANIPSLLCTSWFTFCWGDGIEGLQQTCPRSKLKFNRWKNIAVMNCELWQLSDLGADDFGISQYTQRDECEIYDMYHLCEMRMKDFIDEGTSQLWTQLTQLRKENLKNPGLNGSRTHDLCEIGANIQTNKQTNKLPKVILTSPDSPLPSQSVSVGIQVFWEVYSCIVFS